MNFTYKLPQRIFLVDEGCEIIVAIFVGGGFNQTSRDFQPGTFVRDGDGTVFGVSRGKIAGDPHRLTVHGTGDGIRQFRK